MCLFLVSSSARPAAALRDTLFVRAEKDLQSGKVVLQTAHIHVGGLVPLSLKKSSRDQQVLPEVREATINCREGRTKAQVLVELLFVKGAQRLGLVLVGKDGRKLRLLDARDGLNLGPGPQLIGREAEVLVQLGREAGRFFFLRPRPLG